MGINVLYRELYILHHNLFCNILITWKRNPKSGIVVYIFNPRTWKSEGREGGELWAQGLPDLHSVFQDRPVSKDTNKNKRNSMAHTVAHNFFFFLKTTPVLQS